MTVMSFTLCAVEVTVQVLEITVWWGCDDCGVDIALPAHGTEGFLVPCPDCSEPLHELWRWEPVDRRPAGRQPARRGSVAA
jgi:hypothetical protein